MTKHVQIDNHIWQFHVLLAPNQKIAPFGLYWDRFYWNLNYKFDYILETILDEET